MLTFSEWENVIATVDDPASQLVADITWHTGLNVGEVLALTVQKVDLSSNTIRDNDLEIPISADLQTKLRDYGIANRADAEPRDRFFPGITEGHVVSQILKAAKRLHRMYHDGRV